jgi:hypothetical protein
MYLMRYFLFAVEMCDISLCSDGYMVHKFQQLMNMLVYDFGGAYNHGMFVVAMEVHDH